MNRNGDILICAAVEEEISPLIRRLENARQSGVGGKRMFAGKLAGKGVRAVVTGAGLVNCTHAITCALENFLPSLLIQTGCAGAFARSGIGIGDIGIASEEIDAQLGLELDDVSGPGDCHGGFKFRELPFALFVKNGISYKNRYPADSDLVDRARGMLEKSRDESGGPKIGTGPFLTVSTITATDERADRLFSLYRPCMESMEGSAAAQLSILYDIPFLEIRGAANLVGKRDRAAWNIPLACENACEAVFRVVAGMDR